MSIQIMKSGMQDTIQDCGRFGHRHLGINTGGVMDDHAFRVANMLVGNKPTEAVIEMHFPGPTILFERETLIALSGADFSATINGEEIPLSHPILVCKNSVLQFHKKLNGSLSYLAVRGGFKISKWLKSKSTNLKIVYGGYQGRSLMKGDVIKIKATAPINRAVCEKDFIVLPWQTDSFFDNQRNNELLLLKGPEWDYLTEKSKKDFLEHPFFILPSSDRMGYRLSGPALNCTSKKEIISSGVGFGTIQLLPDGQLIVLMADHQTTGGYPRIAQVVTANLSKFAQKSGKEKIEFKIVEQAEAETLLVNQSRHMKQLQNACSFRLEEYIHKK
jgi:antagonist of KipI